MTGRSRGKRAYRAQFVSARLRGGVNHDVELLAPKEREDRLACRLGIERKGAELANAHGAERVGKGAGVGRTRASHRSITSSERLWIVRACR